MSAVSVLSGAALNPGEYKHKSTQQKDSNQESGFVCSSLHEKASLYCKSNGVYEWLRINRVIIFYASLVYLTNISRTAGFRYLTHTMTISDITSITCVLQPI